MSLFATVSRRLNLATLVVGSLVLALSSCQWFAEDDPEPVGFPSRGFLDIVGADALAIGRPGDVATGAVSASFSATELRLLRVDDDGSIRVVDHRDESGRSFAAPVPLEITPIDSEWVSIVYSTYGDPSWSDIAVLANISTGSYYLIPAEFALKHGGRWARVSDEKLYLLLYYNHDPVWGGKYGIFEIEPQDNPVARERNVPTDNIEGGFGGSDETLPAFAVDRDGLLIYRGWQDGSGFAEPRLRVLDTTGRVYPEPDEQIDFFFTGLDGNAYVVSTGTSGYLNEEALETGSVVTTRQISIVGGQIVFDEFGTTDVFESFGGMIGSWHDSMIRSDGESIAVISVNSAIEVYRTGFDGSVDSLRSSSAATTMDDPVFILDNPPIITNTDVTWLIDGALRVFSIDDFAFTDVAIDAGYEINRIYPAGDELAFDGLRYSDGTSVSGTIDTTSGAVTVEQLGRDPIIFELVPLN